jgi:hypothetical protein
MCKLHDTPLTVHYTQHEKKIIKLKHCAVGALGALNNWKVCAIATERNPTRSSSGTSVSGTQQKFPSHNHHFSKDTSQLLLDPEVAHPVQHLLCTGEAHSMTSCQPNSCISIKAVFILCIKRQRIFNYMEAD